RGLTPRPEASKATLLRRVYFDLTGLPPAADELHAFLKDESPDAYEKVVDRLLASPRYGERWGRHWMDVWRYSAWAGWEGGGQIRQVPRPHVRPDFAKGILANPGHFHAAPGAHRSSAGRGRRQERRPGPGVRRGVDDADVSADSRRRPHAGQDRPRTRRSRGA